MAGPGGEERRLTARAEEGEWSEYQRLVLTELERHGNILGNLPETLETLREEVRDQRHELAQVKTLIVGYNLAETIPMIREHEKRLNRVELVVETFVPKPEIDSIKDDVKGLNFRYYAVVAGLVTALAIVVGLMTNVWNG